VTTMTGKQAVMEMLMAEGVKYIFGNPGTSEGPILDALEDYPDLQYVLTSQEGAAMGMADGYSRATGQVSFVNLHIETGLANGLSLLHNARDGGTPMVVTSANKDIRKLAEGRSDLSEMVRLFSKWSVEVTEASQIPAIMRRAFTEAKTPPTGPVYVGFSANALDGIADMQIIPSSEGYFRIPPDEKAISDATEAIGRASCPVLIVGDRLSQSGGVEEAVRLAETIGAKVYATSYSEMNFPTDHPLFFGLIGAGTPDGRSVLAENDVVIAIGTNVFPGFFYFEGHALSDGTSLIHIDSAQREIGKSEPTDIGIAADPRRALQELNESLDSSTTGTFREEVEGRLSNIKNEVKERESQVASVGEDISEANRNSHMSAERMMQEVAKVLPHDAVIADDSVTSRTAIHSAMSFSEPGSIHGERGGALGWGMGGALGIKLAHPNRPVVAIVGDGSAMMTVQSLWTAANLDIPVVYIICNNRSYRILKLNMDVYKNEVLKEDNPSSKYLAMDFPNPMPLARIAEAMGIFAREIDRVEDIAPTLTAALKLGKPALLDISIDGSV